MKKEKIYLSLCLCLLCASCTNDPIVKDGDENPHISQSKLVPIEIVLDPTIGYNQQEPPATRIGTDGQTESVPLLAEWAAVKHFSAINAAYNGPAMASMKLQQDIATPTTDDQINTRGTIPMDDYVRFRLIIFRKEGGKYVHHSTVDYQMFASGLNKISNGNTNVPVGSTIRVLGYTYNANVDHGEMPERYEYGTSSIPVFNDKDFATFDSDDQPVKSSSFDLKVKFVHRLCKLTIKIDVTGFRFNDYSGINASVNPGGANMRWIVGTHSSDPVQGEPAAASFTMNRNDWDGVSIRCLPSSAPEPITVSFKTGVIGGFDIKDVTVSSTSEITMESGKSYTMTVRFKKTLGTQLKPEQIHLCANEEDKISLSKLTWADGNLKGTELGKYEWDEAKGNGHYYTHMSVYTFEGDTRLNRSDPCRQLNPEVYGTGWRTPARSELELLCRCSSDPEYADVWCMANKIGIYLHAAGWRRAENGCGTTGSYSGGTGIYQSTQLMNYAAQDFFALRLEEHRKAFMQGNGIRRTQGTSVRCVKGEIELADWPGIDDQP